GATHSHEAYTQAVEMTLSVANGTYEGNTYYGIGREYAHGHYLVKAVIEGEKIQSVEIVTATQDPESDSIVADKVKGEYPYDAAVETFAKWSEMVVDNQSVTVDVVSGATHSDHGLNNALAQCLTQAGLSPDDYK
ncbi:MAG: FMN-binding protein, partial [Halanaerobiales bacterium]|nr:FMN-binding protein [Halanaerobiales bacterium]